MVALDNLSFVQMLVDAFEPAFMQRALIGSLLAVVVTSLVGTWVVLRGLAFLGDAIAHGVIPGIALAVLWGFSPIVGALVAAAVMACLVSLVSARTVIREDTGIGLLFVGMLSLGIVIVSKARSFTTEVTSLLFGDVLGVTRSDINGQFVAAAIVVVATIGLYRPFMALTFNAMKAQSLGMHPKAVHLALMMLLAISIVASFQAVGTLLGLRLAGRAASHRVAPHAACPGDDDRLHAVRSPCRRCRADHQLPRRHGRWRDYGRSQRRRILRGLARHRGRTVPVRARLSSCSSQRLKGTPPETCRPSMRRVLWCTHGPEAVR